MKRARSPRPAEDIPSKRARESIGTRVGEWVKTQSSHATNPTEHDESNLSPFQSFRLASPQHPVLLERPSSDMDQSFRSGESEKPSAVQPSDPNYETVLQDYGIKYLWKTSPPPPNLDEVYRALRSARGSPAPSRDMAQTFVKRVDKCRNEGDVMDGLLHMVLPLSHRLWDSMEDAHSINAQWDRLVLLKPGMTAVSPAKPDKAFGFDANMVDFPQAKLFLRHIICPIPLFAWPYFTIECKGPQGLAKVAGLQNAYNSAIMLNNMFRLKRKLGTQEAFFHKIQVMTMILTPSEIVLHGHYVIPDSSAGIEFHSVRLATFSSRDVDSFNRAYRGCMNAVEWTRKATLDRILADMATLEKKLVKSMHEGLTQMTPPSTQLERPQRSRGRRVRSRGSSVSGSLSRKRSNLSSEVEP